MFFTVLYSFLQDASSRYYRYMYSCAYRLHNMNITYPEADPGICCPLHLKSASDNFISQKSFHMFRNTNSQLHIQNVVKMMIILKIVRKNQKALNNYISV